MKAGSEEILPVEFESLVEDCEEEASNHGPDKAANAVDPPKVEEDDFVVAAVEVHLHHHVVHGGGRGRGRHVHVVVLKKIKSF